jgi:hypothetical protein
MAMTSWRNGFDMMSDGWPVYLIDRAIDRTRWSKLLMAMSSILQRSLLTIHLIIITFRLRGSIRSAPQTTSATLLNLDHQGHALSSDSLSSTTIARAISRNNVPYGA